MFFLYFSGGSTHQKNTKQNHKCVFFVKFIYIKNIIVDKILYLLFFLYLVFDIFFVFVSGGSTPPCKKYKTLSDIKYKKIRNNQMA